MRMQVYSLPPFYAFLALILGKLKFNRMEHRIRVFLEKIYLRNSPIPKQSESVEQNPQKGV